MVGEVVKVAKVEAEAALAWVPVVRLELEAGELVVN